MKALLPIHKNLLALTVTGAILVLCLFYYVSEPAGQAYENLSGTVEDLNKQLRGLDAPADENMLARLQTAIDTRQKNVRGDIEKVLALYAASYEPAIQKNNWTVEAFVRQAPKPTRDLYMQEFDRIIGNSPYGNLVDEQGRLGLSRDLDSEERYQLLLQLWCLESLLSQAHDCKLNLAYDALEEHEITSRNRRRGARKQHEEQSKLRSACVMALVPEEISVGKRTLLRLRFRLGVIGRLSAIVNFVDSLGAKGTFFGIGAFELQHLPPKTGKPTSDRLQLNIECVTYVRED